MAPRSISLAGIQRRLAEQPRHRAVLDVAIAAEHFHRFGHQRGRVGHQHAEKLETRHVFAEHDEAHRQGCPHEQAERSP